MNFVIGDIHGELAKLKALTAQILERDADAAFIFIGDYLDKGEDVYGTLQFLTKLASAHACTFLRGNHEFFWELLKSNDDKHAAYLTKYGGRNTAFSVTGGFDMLATKKILFSEFASLFRSLKNYHELDRYVITHSGIDPSEYGKPLADISTDKLLFNRYDFLRCEQLYQGKKIIFGHTGFYTPLSDGVKIGIDTAACYLQTQPLTAFCADADFFINSNGDTVHLNAIDPSCCPSIPRVKAWRQL